MTVGDRVYYLLPQLRRHGRECMWALPATVEKVGEHRVTILLDTVKFSRRRSVAPFSLRLIAEGLPPGIEIH